LEVQGQRGAGGRRVVQLKWLLAPAADLAKELRVAVDETGGIRKMALDHSPTREAVAGQKQPVVLPDAHVLLG
jgi:hypothetical protein